MQVTVTRLRDKRLEIRARGVRVTVDELPENGGPGDGLRPTELLLGALGACMAGTMLGFAANQGIPVDAVEVELEDEVAQAPKRIGGIAVSMEVTGDLAPRQLESLRRVASACKIHNTLASSPEIRFSFRAAEAAS